MDEAGRVFGRDGRKPSKRVAERAEREIGRWVKSGHLHEKHRGVYAVGHREITTEGRFLAAVKACGDDAALSHYAAAALWGLVEWDGRRIDVTAPTRREHPGIRTHRTSNPERTLHKNIPVTPVARTLDDLSPALPFKRLRRAVREAFDRGLITTAELARAKSKQLRVIAADIVPTRSVLEDLARLDDAVRTQRLPDRVVRISWTQAVLEPAKSVARLRAEELRSRGAAHAPRSGLPAAA